MRCLIRLPFLVPVVLMAVVAHTNDAGAQATHDGSDHRNVCRDRPDPAQVAVIRAEISKILGLMILLRPMTLDLAAQIDPDEDTFFCCDQHGCHQTSMINIWFNGSCPEITLVCNDEGLCIPLGEGGADAPG